MFHVEQSSSKTKNTQADHAGFEFLSSKNLSKDFSNLGVVPVFNRSQSNPIFSMRQRALLLPPLQLARQDVGLVRMH